MSKPLPLLSRRSKITLAAALVFGVGATWSLQQLKPAQPLEPSPVVRAVLDDPGSPRVGAAKPDVTIVVFTDYRCPICQKTAPALLDLQANDRGVQVIFKDWPIRGPGSQLAARAALAAERQGRYRPFHVALMASRGQLDAARIEAIAADAGLDVPRLRADLAAHGDAIDAQLGRHGMQAFSLGLQGTPAYLVGPYLISGGLDARQLAAAVKRARRG